MTNEEYMENNPIQPDMTWEDLCKWAKFDKKLYVYKNTYIQISKNNKERTVDGDLFIYQKTLMVYKNGYKRTVVTCRSYKAIKRVITAILEGVER